MIIFHEGMPGSGKSYATMVDHIIPALQKGRKVYARMNGLDRQRIAEAGDLALETVERLLVDVSEEDVRSFCTCKRVNGDREWQMDADALFILDELQNHYPQQRQKLDPETMQFITEHRHRGLDIVVMGQLLKDCHKIWVNRVNRKIQFMNKDVLGKPNDYKWVMYNGKPDNNGNVEFIEVTKGDGSYDPKYFGTYRSHQTGTENTERLADDRANIWKSPIFRKWLPLLGVAVLLAAGYIIYLFNGGLASSGTAQKPPSTPQKPLPNQQAAPISVPPPQPPASAKVADKGGEWDLTDVVTKLTEENRPRLAGVLRSARGTKVVIEWRDKSQRVVESMTSEQLKILGWHPLVTDDNSMVVLLRPGHRLVATAWPIYEPVAKVTDRQTEQMKRETREAVKVAAKDD